MIFGPNVLTPFFPTMCQLLNSNKYQDEVQKDLQTRLAELKFVFKNFIYTRHDCW